jgi:hypothetical protein
MTPTSIVDWWFRDRTTGAYTVGQPPNTLATVLTVATVAHRLVPSRTRVGVALGVVETGALAFFGADELVRGVNPWRRLIGATALAVCIRRARRA